MVPKLWETTYRLVWSLYDVVSPPFEFSSPPLQARAAISLIPTPGKTLRAPTDVRRGTGNELRSSIAKLRTPFVYRHAPNSVRLSSRSELRSSIVTLRTPFVYRHALNSVRLSPSSEQRLVNTERRSTTPLIPDTMSVVLKL